MAGDEDEVEVAVEAEADEVGNNDGGTLSGELNVSDKMLQRYLLFNLNCLIMDLNLPYRELYCERFGGLPCHRTLFHGTLAL